MMPLFLFFGHETAAQDKPFLRVSAADSSSLHRVLIESSFALHPRIEKSGEQLFVKITTARTVKLEKTVHSNPFIKALDWIRKHSECTLIITTADSRFSYDTFSIKDPPQLFINIRPEVKILQDEKPAVAPARSGQRTNIKSSRTPAQGKSTIVIDPGHGGPETGAKGKFGTLEKNITLAVSKKLKAIIERKLAFNVILTRDEDVEISLEQRTALANYHNAFLFISIHANSSFRGKASGPETYFLSASSTDREARRLAFLENNGSELGGEIEGSDKDDIKMILWDMAQSAFLRESSLLAEQIQKELNGLLKTRDRGVKQAPFYVLAGVACPAVLVETAFLSNPSEEKKLTSEKFQTQLAQAIFRGLVQFIRDYSNE